MLRSFGKHLIHLFFGLIAFTFIYTFACTIYYNLFDSRLSELSAQFHKGHYGEMLCDADESYRDEGGNPVMPHCWGGVLEQRDTHLEEQGVAAYGEWRSDGWIFFANTFQIYFKYKW